MGIEGIYLGQISPAYCTETELILHGDTFLFLEQLTPGSVDMVFADPPYFLSNDGVTCQAGKMVSVNKGRRYRDQDEITFGDCL